MSCKGKGRATETATPPVLTGTRHHPSEHRSRDAEDSRATAPIGFDERGVMQPDTGIGSPVYRPLEIDGLDIGSEQHEINPNPGIFIGFDLHM